ncbi:MAG: hypothetical protein IIU35_01340 [Neisseriaceae bacterium]|nr:hypothetical protein [Neisseriaceae bacterium]
MSSRLPRLALQGSQYTIPSAIKSLTDIVSLTDFFKITLRLVFQAA